MKKEIKYENGNMVIEYGNWNMVVDLITGIVTVELDGEARTYQIPNKIIEIRQDNEYVHILIDTKKEYQFKFEYDNFLAGDIFDMKGEFIDSFATHVFGEDC